jgi:ABC-type glycerol-3-phosphate transport system substrate-binding protein
MKNLKKVLILLLVVVLAAGVLTACAGKAEKSGEGKKFVIATDKGHKKIDVNTWVDNDDSLSLHEGY